MASLSAAGVGLVPQQLTDLRQGCAGTEKLGGEAVPEDMGAAVCAALDADAIKTGLGDHRDCACGRKSGVGRKAAEK